MHDGARMSGTMDGPIEDLNFFALIGTLIRHRVAVLLLAFGVAAVFVLHAFTLDPAYRASASFVVQGGGGDQSRLLSLARGFGFNTGTGTDRSPRFYLQLLDTRRILEEAARGQYRVEHNGVTRTVSLADALGIEGADAEQRTRAAVKQLRESLTTSEGDAGMVNVSVTAPSAGLAEQLVTRLLSLVEQVNTELQQESAAATRRFVQGQMATAQQELSDAEDVLARFLEQNRRYENSPELTFQVERLRRQVALKQEVYTSLAQTYEQSSIEAARNTPQISIIERPAGSASTVQAHILMRLVLGFLLGAFVGVLIAFGRELYRRAEARGNPDLEEMKRQWAEASVALRAARARAARKRVTSGADPH